MENPSSIGKLRHPHLTSLLTCSTLTSLATSMIQLQTGSFSNQGWCQAALSPLLGTSWGHSPLIQAPLPPTGLFLPTCSPVPAHPGPSPLPGGLPSCFTQLPMGCSNLASPPNSGSTGHLTSKGPVSTCPHSGYFRPIFPAPSGPPWKNAQLPSYAPPRPLCSHPMCLPRFSPLLPHHLFPRLTHLTSPVSSSHPQVDRGRP